MRKYIAAIAIIIILGALVACSKDSSKENSTTISTTATTNVTTTSLRIDEIPEGSEATDSESELHSQLEQCERDRKTLTYIYNQLGIEYLTCYGRYSISDDGKEMKVYNIYMDELTEIGSLFISKNFLEKHDVRFSGEQIEKYVPYAVPDEMVAEYGKYGYPYVIISESDVKTHQAIRWVGQLTITVDDYYTIIVDPETI